MSRTQRSWEWICSALVVKEKGDCGPINLIDTIFIQQEQIWSWYHSTSGGIIRKKSQRKLKVETVTARILEIASIYSEKSVSASKPLFVAVCWNEDQHRLQLLGATEITSFFATCKGNICFSAFVPPRGGLETTRYANVEHEYVVDKDGRVLTKLFRVAMGAQRILSMDTHLHTTATDIVHTIVGYIEKSKKCRVVTCTSLFVLDETNRLFLWRIEQCETVSIPTLKGIETQTVDTSMYAPPQAVNERILARAKADAITKPDDKAIQAILASPTPQYKRQPLLLKSSASQPQLTTCKTTIDLLSEGCPGKQATDVKRQLRTNADWDHAMQFLPTSSTLSRSRKRTLSAAHLISSQKKGCCGDYCNLIVSRLTAKRLERKEAVNSRHLKEQQSFQGRSNSVLSATAAASAFMVAHPDHESNMLMSMQNASKYLKPMSPQRQQNEIVEDDYSVHHTIPFKLVAQTRAEKKLVELFVRRYENGEDGDYLSEEYYGDGEPLGQTFPGYYYQHVQVCRNCFEFYTLVENVRMKALEQVSKRQRSSMDSSRRLSRSQSSTTSISRMDTSISLPLVEEHEQPIKVLEDNTTWKPIWTHAMTVVAPTLKKKDAAELCGFVNPHPAIEMVRTALGILLRKRGKLSQDKLMLQVQRFTLDQLESDQIEELAAHARNSLFAPVHIQPISSCAGRFCEWILTILQAYAWKTTSLFTTDHESWLTLAFLKPELLPSHISRHDYETRAVFESSDKPSCKPTSISKFKGVHVRKTIQEQQMTRLANPTGFTEGQAHSGIQGMYTSASDSYTQIPYTIMGQATHSSTKCNLIIFHDFFDTMEHTKILFRPLLSKHIGARALFFNLPGQSGSTYPSEVFNNTWYTTKIQELLLHLNQTSTFILHGLPFHIIGFGNGAAIATHFVLTYEKQYTDLQSLVLVNGFATIDTQLAAILHTTVNVFSSLPPQRPDLPVSFFSKYLFSERYLSTMDLNLVLSIYTAVTNAITLDGRLQIIKGALHHVDMTAQLPQLTVPLILVQSIENTLVAPTNVDPFLQQRTHIAHAWSHQQSSTTTHDLQVNHKTRKQLRHVLETKKSAFVSWLRAGHELRQEAKQYMTELIEILLCSREVNDKEGTPASPSRESGTSHSLAGTPTTASQGNRKNIKGDTAHRDRAKEFEKEKLEPTIAPVQTPPGTVELVTTRSTPSVTPQGRIIEPASRFLPQSQLARSEQTFQAVMSTHETQRTEFEKSSVETQGQSIDSHNRSASKPSSYQLMLERSEQAFQEALRTHETQKSEFEKTNWLREKQEKRPTLQVDSPSLKVSTSSEESTSVRAISTSTLQWSTLQQSAPPSIPVVETKIIPHAPLSYPDEIVPPPRALHNEIEQTRAKLQAEEQRMATEAEQLRVRQRRAAEERMEALRQEQERRRRQWEEEDKARLAELEKKLHDEQVEREVERQRREQVRLAHDLSVMASSPIPIKSYEVDIPASLPLASDLIAPTMNAMKQQLRMQPDLPSIFDQMEAEERARNRIGLLRRDEYDEVKKAVTQNYMHQVKEHESFLRQELSKRKHQHAIRIQCHIRRYLAIIHVMKRRQERQVELMKNTAGAEIVRIVRGFMGRRRFYHHRVICEQNARQRYAAIALQRIGRGYLCRVKFRRLRRHRKAREIQRVYRGYRGRLQCITLSMELKRRRHMHTNATKLQATWRMHKAREIFLTKRMTLLAAMEIQRIYRGHLGRKEALRKKAWHDAEPGPERLALGLKMIEGSKQAFERQQHEIDALHRAQETVEKQVSTIHTELQASETELAVLERELQEIDQLEDDLRELTHEAEMLHRGGMEGALQNGRNLKHDKDSMIGYEVGVETLRESKEVMKKRQADAYAIEMAIQIKRVEREKKKKDLEIEFTSVFAEVQQKRRALTEMEEKLAEMEATRMRKDREFARMQRNLMELLEEQKLELENLREKGIELETATATSAAAAAATAMKAKEHEKRSQAMFESTEELMKFQFMSMSLSYFSSLNMLKNLRDINADTTSAAISSTAETAAAAAAAAAAANIPTMKRLQVGGSDLMMAASQVKKTELDQKVKEEAAAIIAGRQPLPDQVREWNVDDVGRWLDSLALSQYKASFKEGAVDGEFLLELRPEDMSDVLGVTHKLHVRKIMVARNKLLPLSEQEKIQIEAVEHEANARQHREGVPASSAVLDAETVLSQARNGRLKRLIESIDAGFDINTEDEKGNTLLLIACQNVNMKMVEYLVAKRANVNHKNAQGNTPLHFAMAYDTEGKLGEYLIAHGADDTIENVFGLTPYDGLTAE